MRTNRRIGIAAAALLAATVAAAAEPCPAHLFVIARSKNANIVVYDARRGSSGDLDPANPVEAYWLLDGKEGAREEMNRIERQRAYGFDIAPASEAGTWELTFKAGGKRRPRIRLRDGCPAAILPIGGKDAVLRRIFIQSKEGIFQPTVQYVELFGDDLATGEPRYEKFTP
ncbi:MAG TPA: DUF4833 domain-containing protein [Thermoanaerobaculia bacterium]|nr:DUF4833 domain-containing protein [Thermoanaerobaculia bacterium]